MDTTTIALAMGLIISLIFTEAFGLSGGGMIVPGYFALYLDQPGSLALTMLAAFLTYAIVTNLSRVAIVYGRRRIALMILFGFLVGAGIRGMLSVVPWQLASTGLDASTGCLCVIGFIIPGLIALWMDRQGIIETLGPLVTSSVLVRLVLVIAGLEVLL